MENHRSRGKMENSQKYLDDAFQLKKELAITSFVKSHLTNTLSYENQPTKVLPSLVGAIKGSVAFSPAVTVWLIILLPPFVSKVTTHSSLALLQDVKIMAKNAVNKVIRRKCLFIACGFSVNFYYIDALVST